MLIVTDKAAQYLCETLTRKPEGSPEALRVVYTEDGYQLTLDDTKDGDQVFEQEGKNYLFVDAQVGEALSDAKLDVQESAQGKRVTLLATKTPDSEPEAESESGAKPEPEPKAKPEPVPDAKLESAPEAKT
jgi:Fe-S cluster assembly iron-binding protein IscA